MLEITNWVMNGVAGEALTTVELCVLETIKHKDASETQNAYDFTVTGENATTAYITEHLQEFVDAHKQELVIESQTPEAQLKALRDAIHTAINLADIPDKVALDAVALFPTWAEGVAYTVGERISYQGMLYKVLKAHSSRTGWEPNHVDTLFSLVTDTPAYPEWVRHNGAGYKKGDIVTHKGRVWISTYNDNLWEPGSLGWDEVK